MTLIAMIGKMAAYVSIDKGVYSYHFRGGDYGPHDITIGASRPMHTDTGIYGRPGVHWDGYVQATRDNARRANK